jgi:DNA-binding transcriptional ArsR family regulator
MSINEAMPEQAEAGQGQAEAGQGQADTGPGQAGAAPERVAAGLRYGDLRQVTDARTMRALAHPVRIALLEMLSLEGAMTATEVGERISESPTTCSFHLRQLAKYGFVEEAGGGKGRARPWQMSTVGIQLAGAHDDPDTQLAEGALLRMIRDRQLDRYRTWRESKTSYPRQWQEAADDSEYVLFLTAEELKQLSDELSGLLQTRFQDRVANPSLRPAGSLPVELLVISYPINLPGEAYLPGGQHPPDTSPPDTSPPDTSPPGTGPPETGRPAESPAGANQEGSFS